MAMLTLAVGLRQLIVIHDRLGLAGRDRSYRDQDVPGYVHGRHPARPVVACSVQQRALAGQPQVQLSVELRHPSMLPRIPAWTRIRAGSLGGFVIR
jgi:hypothetical protein